MIRRWLAAWREWWHADPEALRVPQTHDPGDQAEHDWQNDNEGA